MKKHLLLGLTLGLGIAAIAQTQSNNLLKPSIAKKSFLYTKGKEISGNENGSALHQSSNSQKAVRSMSRSMNGTIIGQTWYDLQTNAAVARRIVNHGDGTLSAVWTTCSDASPYNTRGTGYQYFNGTAWFPQVTTRLEPNHKTGWPNIGLLGSGKEFIMCHDGTVVNLQQGNNTVKGSQTWSFATSGATVPMAPSTTATIWARMAVSGTGDSTIHVVSNCNDTLILRKGVKSPFLYSRSLNNGTTWSIKDSVLPGYTSARTKQDGGDEYDIDAQNTNVAIVRGGLAEDVILWRSSDNGNTFTQILVDSIPFVRNMTGAAPTDTMYTNDGSVSVVLDNNNKAHVAYSLAKTLSPSSGVVNYFPGTIGLVYWNEITKTKVSVPILMADIDLNGNGIYDIGDSATSRTACAYRESSILTFPSIAVDASGNVFIVFSMPQDADTTVAADGFSISMPYRDIWVVAFNAATQTWTKVQNVTSTVHDEDVFACVAKLVDNDLHILFMEDTEPGTALNNANPDNSNNIRYLKVSTADILAGVVGINNLASRNELFSVSQNYPNPFSKETNISVNLNKASDLNITVSNLIGQELMVVTSGNVASGVHNFVIDGSKLSAGIYLYNVKAGDYSVTKKMVIQ